MPVLDDIAPNYVRAKQRWSDAPLLARYYNSLKSCYEGSSHGLVEHVKSFLESVCLTIMAEFKVPKPSENPNTTELLVSALAPLGIRNSRGANKLDKVLSNFNKLTDALNEMRNESGPLAHGKDGFLDPISSDHARAFLHTVDVVLGLLLNVEEGKEPDLVVTREPYERFQHLNSRIDGAVSLKARTEEEEDRSVVVISVSMGPNDSAIELRAEASEILYGLDREAYVEVLKTIKPTKISPKETAIIEQEPPRMPLLVSRTVDPTPSLVEKYSGRLKPLAHEIQKIFEGKNIPVSLKRKDNSRLIDSTLATIEKHATLDWFYREVAKAKLRVAIKRLLLNFEVHQNMAGLVATQLIDWLGNKKSSVTGLNPDGKASMQDTQS